MTPEEELGMTLDQLIYKYNACGSRVADLLRELKQRRQDMAGLDAGTHVVVPRDVIAETASLLDEIVEELYDYTLEDRPLLGVGIDECREKLVALSAAQEKGHG